MQRVAKQIPPTIFETFPRAVSRTANNSSSLQHSKTASSSFRQFQSSPATMASSNPAFAEYKIENTTFPTAPGVSLSESQQVITGSVLDLFSGRPSLRKLKLWQDDATFADPLTIAEGRKQYSAQWYGLPAVFSQIERLGGQVTNSGNPIEVEMRNKYTVKGINKEQTIDSKIKIWTEGEGPNMRIKRVEDRWDDSIPEGAFAKAMRNLNSVVVPGVVKVPNSIEEEEASK